MTRTRRTGPDPFDESNVDFCGLRGHPYATPLVDATDEGQLRCTLSLAELHVVGHLLGGAHARVRFMG